MPVLVLPTVGKPGFPLGTFGHCDTVVYCLGVISDMSKLFVANSSDEGASQPVPERGQLVALLFVDVCGSSRVMRRNEGSALRSIVQSLQRIADQVTEHGGVVRNTRGDGLFATFSSAHDAAHCGLAIQTHARMMAGGLPIAFRIGIHIGEAFNVGGQILGDSVNVAARIEGMAEPGGVLVSRPVYEALRGDTTLRFDSVGKPFLKNLGNDLELFRTALVNRRQGPGLLELQLLGEFVLSTADGARLAVPPETQLLLAAVALSPSRAVSRRWLQDTFWGHRPAKQRPARLKMAIASLRDVLGPNIEQVLQSDEKQVALARASLASDVDTAIAQGWSGPGPLPELLRNCEPEGISARNWLFRERRRVRNAICLVKAGQGLAPRILHAYPPVDEAAPTSAVFAIGILPPATEGDDGKSSWIADLLVDWLSRSLAEVEAVEIHDYRLTGRRRLLQERAEKAAGPDLLIQCRSATAGDMAQLSVTALRTEDRKIVWSQSVVADQRELLGMAGQSMAAFVSYATDALLSALASGRHMREPAVHMAAKTAIGAVHRLLTMTGPGLDRVETDIMAAYEADPKPVYLAWLAYMATFQVGERYGVRDATLEEQARAMARRALEADPHNALVLGLVAHVHSYIFREFAFADDLIARAIETNPACALSWDSASLLYAYTGRGEESMRAALNARQLGRHSPYRHLFDGACCVASAVNRNFDEAVSYGESVIAVQPEFKAVLRYLAACYGHLGDSVRAREVMERLMRLEPDLSVERLRDQSYPVPSRTNAKLIETGLARVGLKRHP